VRSRAVPLNAVCPLQECTPGSWSPYLLCSYNKATEMTCASRKSLLAPLAALFVRNPVCGRVRADQWEAPTPRTSIELGFKHRDRPMPLLELLNRMANVTEGERICTPVDGVCCRSKHAVLDTDGYWRAPACCKDYFMVLPPVMELEFLILQQPYAAKKYGKRAPHIVELPEAEDFGQLLLPAALEEWNLPTTYTLQSMAMR
jgi:hypothetical protein